MTKKERQFVEMVWDYYREHGRRTLPWRQRKHQEPYDILVSEVMLQQTQVQRVIPKYRAFIKKWPTTNALAKATLAEVLTMWQGLGYNRRAKLLWQCAQHITKERRGRWPQSYDELQRLPGVGPYTAGAVMAFAYNEAVPLVETNVRTVYIHHFFNRVAAVTDAEILSLVQKTLAADCPREWYAALMDYGAHLKKTQGNNIAKSKHYKKQSAFRGSDREVRGAIIKVLAKAPATRMSLTKQLIGMDAVKIDQQIEKLVAELMIKKIGRNYQLPTT